MNLVVARYAKTQMKELELTVNRFEQAGVKVNGFILNDIQRAKRLAMAMVITMLMPIKPIRMMINFKY